MCPCYCCCYLRAPSETSELGGVVLLKRMCLAAYPISAARKEGPAMNRISHPDWVKLCVELICAPNQNTKFSSATKLIHCKKSRRLFESAVISERNHIKQRTGFYQISLHIILNENKIKIENG